MLSTPGEISSSLLRDRRGECVSVRVCEGVCGGVYVRVCVYEGVYMCV